MAVSNIVSLFRARPVSRDWSNQELAEFYRVESALISVGFRVDTERGLSDEGEPWFVFIDGMSDDVIVHCARIDGAYVIASAAFDSVLRGPDFRSLVETFLERHPLVLPPADTPEKKSNIRLHPAAFLVALVATAFFKLSTNEASASELDEDDGFADGVRLPEHDTAHAQLGAELDKRQTMAVLAAIAVVTTQLHGDTNLTAGEQQSARFISDSETSQNNRDSDNAAFASTAAGQESRGNALTGDVIVSGFQESMPSTYNALSSDTGNILSDLLSVRKSLPDVLSDSGKLTETSVSFSSPKDAESQKGSSTHIFHEDSGLGSGDSSTGYAQARLAQTRLATANADSENTPAAADALTYNAETNSRQSAPILTAVDNHISFETDQTAAIRDKMPSAPGITPASPATPSEPAAPEQAEQPDKDNHAIDVSGILNAVAPHLSVNLGRIQYSDEAHAYDEQARELISSFVRKDINSTSITHGSDVVLIDSNISKYGNSDINFVTWSFDDGSTISLIGVFDYGHAA